MDHRPGPNIARARAAVPNSSQTHLSPAIVSIFQISINATEAPTIGVHKPTISRSPAPSKSAAGIVTLIGGRSVHSLRLARTISAEPMTARMRSKPTPGQPPANVEYKRRKAHPSRRYQFRCCRVESKPQIEPGMSLFRVLRLGCGSRLGGTYSSMIPLFRPIIAAWVRSLAPSLERMLLTRLLTVSSVMES